MVTAPKLRFDYTPIEYMDMYEMLKEKFIRKEWPNVSARPKTEYGIWLKQGKKAFRVTEEFKVNYRYLYDKYGKAKKGKSISLDEELAVAILDYIGFDGRVFTQQNERFLKSPKRPSRKRNAKNGAIAQTELAPETSEWDPAIDTVLRFYDAINNGPTHHEEAWSYLTPRLQQSICEGDFERFCEGYNNTVAIKNIKIFNVARTGEGTVECTVYYVDEIRNYQTPTLSGWDGFTVAHLDEFVSKVKRLKAEVEAAGGREFDRIELYKLFEPAASTYVWYKCRIKRDNIPLVFPNFKHIEVKHLYRVTCKRVQDDWLIDTIRLLNVYSSR